jgi:hypothetical protein
LGKEEKDRIYRKGVALSETLKHLQNLLAAVKISTDPIEAGYQFYLTFRKFVGDNLLHLHEEETKLLPELQSDS